MGISYLQLQATSDPGDLEKPLLGDHSSTVDDGDISVGGLVPTPPAGGAGRAYARPSHAGRSVGVGAMSSRIPVHIEKKIQERLLEFQKNPENADCFNLLVHVITKSETPFIYSLSVGGLSYLLTMLAASDDYIISILLDRLDADIAMKLGLMEGSEMPNKVRNMIKSFLTDNKYSDIGFFRVKEPDPSKMKQRLQGLISAAGKMLPDRKLKPEEVVLREVLTTMQAQEPMRFNFLVNFAGGLFPGRSSDSLWVPEGVRLLNEYIAHPETAARMLKAILGADIAKQIGIVGVVIPDETLDYLQTFLVDNERPFVGEKSVA
jgi:hypothetical protein